MDVKSASWARAKDEQRQQGRYKAIVHFQGQKFEIEGEYDLGERAMVEATIMDRIRYSMDIRIVDSAAPQHEGEAEQ
jgi:hypothetical protein